MSPGRVIGEVRRHRFRPLDRLLLKARRIGRWRATDHVEGFEEAHGDLVRLAARQPPRTVRAVEAFDRHEIGHAVAHEAVAQMALDQYAADAGKLAVELRHRGFVGNDGTVEIVEQRRAGNLHVHRTSEGEIEVRRVLRPQRQHGVKSGRAGKEQRRGGKARQIFAGVGDRPLRGVVQVSRGVERQQNRNGACDDFRQNFCDRRIQLCQRVSLGFQRLQIGERGAHRAPVDVGRRQAMGSSSRRARHSAPRRAKRRQDR